VVLIALGVRLLWQTRQRFGSFARRLGRRAMLTVAGLFVLYYVVVPVSMALVATHRPRGVDSLPDVGAPAQAVTITTIDGLDLWALYSAPERELKLGLLPGDAAVAWVEQRPDVVQGRIGGLGLSVGGEQMLEAAAGNEDLRAVVSESTGTRSVRESLVRRGPNAVELALQYPWDLMQTVATAVLSGDAQPAEYERRVAGFFEETLPPVRFSRATAGP
jgi:hypothetical protein